MPICDQVVVTLCSVDNPICKLKLYCERVKEDNIIEAIQWMLVDHSEEVSGGILEVSEDEQLGIRSR